MSVDPTQIVSTITDLSGNPIPPSDPAPAPTPTPAPQPQNVLIDFRDLLTQLVETAAPKAAAAAIPTIQAAVGDAIAQNNPQIIEQAATRALQAARIEVLGNKAALEQRFVAHQASIQAQVDKALTDAKVSPKVHLVIDALVTGVPSLFGIVTAVLTISGDHGTNISMTTSITLVALSVFAWILITAVRALAPVVATPAQSAAPVPPTPTA